MLNLSFVAMVQKKHESEVRRLNALAYHRATIRSKVEELVITIAGMGGLIYLAYGIICELA